MAATYDLFLVCPDAAHRLGALRGVGLEAVARTVGVDLYYRVDKDIALLALRLDTRTATHTLLEKLRDEADAAGAAVLEPARWPTLSASASTAITCPATRSMSPASRRSPTRSASSRPT